MHDRLPEPELKFADGLAYLDREGAGLPIVFLHGSGFSKEVFRGRFSSRTLSQHRLISVDLPGHGQSKDAAHARQTYSYAGLASAMLRFLAAIELGPCVVAGWSLGGQAALEMIGASPDVAGVCAFGAAPANNGPLGLIQSMHVSKALLMAGKATFTRAEAVTFETLCLGPHAGGQFVETILRTDRHMRPAVARSVLYASGLSQKSLLETSPIPVCLMHGGRDPFVRTSYMQSLSAPMLYAGRAQVLEKSGHAPFLDAPVRFDATLKDFADAVASGSMVEEGLAKAG